MNTRTIRLWLAAAVVAAGTTVLAAPAQAAQGPSDCVPKGTAAGKKADERSIAAVSAEMRASGKPEAEIDRVLTNDWCLTKVGEKKSAPAPMTFGVLGDDGGVGPTDMNWTTSLWYENTGYYYAQGVWNWKNHDYASDVGHGCWSAGVGGLDGIGLRLEGSGDAKYDINWAAVYYWGDPALNHLANNYGIGAIEGKTAAKATVYGVEYTMQDYARPLNVGTCGSDVDINVYGGQVLMKFHTLDNTCRNTKVFTTNNHTWSSTSLNSLGAGPWSFGFSWSSGSSGQQWETFGVTGTVCGKNGGSGGTGGGGSCSCDGGGGSGGAGGGGTPVGPPPPPSVRGGGTVGDVNGDGKADVVAVHSSGDLWLYPGNGSTLGSPVWLGNGWTSGWATINVGDLTGDGKADIIATSTAGDMWLYPSNGAGLSERRYLGWGWGTGVATINAGDLTGDGKADIVMTTTTGDMWVYPSNGTSLNSRYFIGNGWNSGWGNINIGDLTGDGKADIVAATTSGDLWVYPSNGTALGNRYWIGNGWSGFAAFDFGDVSGADRKADAIVIHTNGNMYFYPSNGYSLGSPYFAGNGWTGFRIGG